MTEMERRDHAIAEMIRRESNKAKELAAQAHATVEDVNRRVEAVRNVHIDQAQLDSIVKAVNAVRSN